MISSVANFKPAHKEILGLIEKENVRFVNLQFTDILGTLKSVTIPVEQFPDTLEHGKWFDGSSIEGFSRIAESDMYLVPDTSTFTILPWERGDSTTARVICWTYTPAGKPFHGDPRVVLTNVIEEARNLGYVFNTGPELEFFLFKQHSNERFGVSPHDNAGYFDSTSDTASLIRKEVVHALKAMGIQVEAMHHETAAGQHEIDFVYDNALKMADSTITFKYVLKAMARIHGLRPNFMPKPIIDIAGSGMHVHQSLADGLTGQNAFMDSTAEYGLSDVAKYFIAGQLYHARGMSAILAPTVNSYKRLVPGYEAPVHISWARVNRSALIRIPRISPGQPKATRIELRCPDPSCNPYLAFAVMLKCGLDGIKRRIPLPQPIEENLYTFGEAELKRLNVGTLPSSLVEALDELEKDETVQEALGPHLYDRFIEAKRVEWDAFSKYVSPWELDRYQEAL